MSNHENSTRRDVLMILPRNAFPWPATLPEDQAVRQEASAAFVLFKDSDPALRLELKEGTEYGISRLRVDFEWLKQEISMPEKQQMLEALLHEACSTYRRTPERYPLYVRLHPEDLTDIALCARLNLMPYLGAWTEAEAAESEADWQVVTDALRAASSAGEL